jgi:hypothetical protein
MCLSNWLLDRLQRIDILEHVAWSKWMYDDDAFGAARLRGDQPPLVPAGGVRARPRPELLAWLTEGHRHWLASIRSLSDDAELERERLDLAGDGAGFYRRRPAAARPK